MKPTRPIALLAAVLAAASTLAQGTFRFANTGDGTFGVPFEAPFFDRDGVTLLTGSDYWVGVYAGPLGTPDEQLRDRGATLNLGHTEGYFDAQNDAVEVPGVPAGQKARIQLRVWDSEGGTKKTWESATVRGSSESFDSLPLSPLGARGLDLTPLHGLKSTRLRPAKPVKAPADGTFKQLFANSYYLGGPGFSFSAASTTFREFAAGGSVVITELTPGTNPEPLYGPLLIRRSRLSSEISLEPAIPAPMTNGVWSIVGISADGSVIAANRHGEVGWKPKLIRQRIAADLPGKEVMGLSGNSRYAMVLEEGRKLRRLDLENLASVVIRDDGWTGENGGYQFSHDGRVALMATKVWREADGSAESLPTFFRAARLSGDGQTIVGSYDNRPAYWTKAEGIVVLHADEPGVTGELRDTSFDGSVLVGWATTPKGRLQVWTRDGKSYRVADLLPNGTNQALASYEAIVVERVSHDGRTVYGSARYPFRSALAGLVPTNAGWVADLVFPGDGARVTVAPKAGGMQLSVPAPAGFRYQFERGNTLDAWAPVGEPVSGTGTTLSREVGFDGDAGFFRVLAQPE